MGDDIKKKLINTCLYLESHELWRYILGHNYINSDLTNMNVLEILGYGRGVLLITFFGGLILYLFFKNK